MSVVHSLQQKASSNLLGLLQRIRLLGSLYNAILTQNVHAWIYAYLVVSRLARTVTRASSEALNLTLNERASRHQPHFELHQRN